MKKTLIAATIVALSTTSSITMAQNQNFDYKVDRFADVEVLRYQVPGFDDLSLKQKTLVYYLTQAALLDGVRLNIGNQNTVNQRLCRLHVLRGVDRKFCLIFIQKSAAVLGNDLEELIVSDGLPNAVNIVAQSTNGFRRGLQEHPGYR